MLVESIEQLLPEWLERQRWFSKGETAVPSARVIDNEMIVDGDFPKLLWTIVEVPDGARYQVPLGLRERSSMPPDTGGALVGIVDDVAVYDALVDADLSRALFEKITDGRAATSVRPNTAEQSNTSFIVDDAYIVKLFRRLQPGRNPDLEVTGRLTEIGYEHVPEVVGTWRRDDYDLAVCQPFINGGTEGSALAMEEVRKYLQNVTSPNGFGPEAFRLGQVTASLHVALAKVFDTEPYDAGVIADSLEADAHELEPGQAEPLAALVKELRNVGATDAGVAARVHGDYHFAQTLLARDGWFIFDFEGEPVRSMEERAALNSPLKDVTGMLRSLQYHAAMGLAEQTLVDGTALMSRANEWEQLNRDEFLRGYFDDSSVAALLPQDPEVLDLLRRAFEVQKAIYELRYEKAYRPDWVEIPRSALTRLLP